MLQSHQSASELRKREDSTSAAASAPEKAGWINYCGLFGRGVLNQLLRCVNTYLTRWARRKYKRLRAYKRFTRWWSGVIEREPRLFAHWAWMRELAGLR